MNPFAWIDGYKSYIGGAAAILSGLGSMFSGYVHDGGPDWAAVKLGWAGVIFGWTAIATRHAIAKQNGGAK